MNNDRILYRNDGTMCAGNYEGAVSVDVYSSVSISGTCAVYKAIWAKAMMKLNVFIFGLFSKKYKF